MDGIIITAAVILAVIAIIEIVNLFTDISIDGAPAYVTVLPVYADDKLFDMRLEYLWTFLQIIVRFTWADALLRIILMPLLFIIPK